MSSTFRTGACIHVPTHQKELSCGLDNKWYLIYTSSCIGDTCALESVCLDTCMPWKAKREGISSDMCLLKTKTGVQGRSGHITER